MSEFKSLVAHRLKVLRAEAQMTQEELAEASGVSVDSIKGYENQTTVPLLETAYKLACALKCSPNDICGFKR